jgi:hypothetical protein
MLRVEKKPEDLKKGDTIYIDTMACDDVDLVDWYAEQENKELTVTSVEEGTVFVKKCPYGIEQNVAIY